LLTGSGEPTGGLVGDPPDEDPDPEAPPPHAATSSKGISSPARKQTGIFSTVYLSASTRGALTRNPMQGARPGKLNCATTKTGRRQPRYPRTWLADRRLCVPALRQVCLCLELARIMTTGSQIVLRNMSQNGDEKE
jgi:hypothetical protein